MGFLHQHLKIRKSLSKTPLLPWLFALQSCEAEGAQAVLAASRGSLDQFRNGLQRVTSCRKLENDASSPVPALSLKQAEVPSIPRLELKHLGHSLSRCQLQERHVQHLLCGATPRSMQTAKPPNFEELDHIGVHLWERCGSKPT